MRNVLRAVVDRLPYSVRATLQVVKILEAEYGHFRSAATWSCIDRGGNPIPWYTYPAIEYIQQLDLTQKVLFEYGSGNSTLFWSKITKSVVSVENNQEWYAKTARQMPENVALSLVTDEAAYASHIARHDTGFDVIVIDGICRDRCAIEAIDLLNPGGMIILDNADWWVKTAAFLRKSGLIQIDMSGFGPINGYTSTTSFFLRRDFNLCPRHSHQPKHGIGSLKDYAPEGALSSGNA